MTTPTSLDLKYLLLSSYYPGIKPRKLSQYRYIQRKLEMKRDVQYSNPPRGIKFAHSIINLKPKCKAMQTRKKGNSGLQHNRGDAMAFRRANSTSIRRTDTMTLATKGDSAIAVTEPCDILLNQRQRSIPSVWQKKLVRVSRGVRHMEDVYRKSLVDPLNITIS